MKKLFRFLPLYILGGGLACGILRQALFAAADEKGLLSLSHPANLPMILLSCVALLALILYGILADDREYRIPISVPVQAIGYLGAAVAHFWWYTVPTTDMPVFHYMKLIAAILFLALAVCRVQKKRAPFLIPALISFCMMLLCFTKYRQWGQHTQVWEYLFPALSALFLALFSLQFCYLETSQKFFKKAFMINQAALFCTLACIGEENLIYSIGMSLFLIGELFYTPYRMKLPQDVQALMEKLEKEGHQVYAVGGCVRDAILGLVPNDYDLCTDATPEQMCQVFSGYRLIRTGEKHGTVGVVLGHTVYEITTFRTEGEYADNRHPDAVTFVTDLQEDLARRDFTVNAMAFHPKTGYVDPFGGQQDLYNGILRAVGDPDIRFREDALRILRGVRFASRFRLNPEEKTLAAMQELSPLMENLAAERIYTELTQFLCCAEAEDILKFRAILLTVIPQLADSVDFQQHSHHHKYDVFTHTAKVVAAAEKEAALRWAALLHDVGKPAVFTLDENKKGHFYGHAQESARIAQEVLQSLKAPAALREQVLFLIEHHMDHPPADKAALRKKLSKHGGENVRLLLKLQLADQSGKGTSLGGFDRTCEKLFRMLDELEKEEGRLQIRDLKIDGHDLMELGYEAGPALGQCQKQLLEMVLSGEIPNEKEPLTRKAKEILESKCTDV